MGAIHDSRVTVPGALFLLTALISLWVGGVDLPRLLATSGNLLAPVLVAFIAGIGGGYICSALVIFLITLAPGLLFPPVEKLRNLLALPDGARNRLQLTILQDYLFHATAPHALIEAVARRINAYFAACNSILAVWLGFALPPLFGFSGGASHRTLAAILFLITVVFGRISWRARLEIWEMISLWHKPGQPV